MSKLERILMFLFFLILSVLFYVFVTFDLSVTLSLKIAILTLLVMTFFSIFFIEHFFTKPNDVLTNTITLLILVISIASDLYENVFLFWLMIFIVGHIFVLTLATMIIYNLKKSDFNKINAFSNKLHNYISIIGKAKILYSIVLITITVFYFPLVKSFIFSIFLFVMIMLLLNPRKSIFVKFNKNNEKVHGIGKLIQIRNPKYFIFEICEDVALMTGGVVRFALNRSNQKKVYIGLITNVNYSKDSRFAEVVLISENTNDENTKINNLYLCQHQTEAINFSKIVGFVTNETTIDRLKIKFNGNLSQDVEQGMIVYYETKDQRNIYYQITEAKTKTELIDDNDNKDMIEIEAVQLGTLIKSNMTFNKYGWIPNNYTPISLYQDEGQLEYSLELNEKIIGHMKNTSIPIIINMDTSVTHHTAIFGITGSGKSVFSRNYIRGLVEKGTKVICIDFTNEYSSKLHDLNPITLIDTSRSDSINQDIYKLGNEISKFRNAWNHVEIARLRTNIENEFDTKIKEFIEQSQTNVAILELPEVSNNEGILEYTTHFMKSIIKYSKVTSGLHQICIVVEEAHTVVPEWNFAGIDDKISKPLVNTMSQVALQGRKYNLGFLIIAQRTANVSKTILTQCNSMILFNQFDNTSKDFLANYIGANYASMLSSLKQREAICVGSAFKSGVPLLFTVPEINE